MDYMDLALSCPRKAVLLCGPPTFAKLLPKQNAKSLFLKLNVAQFLYDFIMFTYVLSGCYLYIFNRHRVSPYFKQSGTKPNLVAKIWLPTLVTICNGLPKLVAIIHSHIHHMVNTGLDVGPLVKWLSIKVATPAS